MREDLNSLPNIDWETYLEQLRAEQYDDIPDSPGKEEEFHQMNGEMTCT